MSEPVDDAVPPEAAKPRRSSVTMMMMMKKLAREEIGRAYSARFHEKPEAEELHRLAAELVALRTDELRARAELECAKLNISRAYKARHGVDPDAEVLAEAAAEVAAQRRAAALPRRPRQLPLNLAEGER